MTEAERLFDEAFPEAGRYRTPRSAAYKEGVRAGIVGRLRRERGEPMDIPMDRYAPGTAEFDAYASGIDEGHAIVIRDRAEKAQAKGAK